MKKLVTYQTSDGKVHNSLYQACDHLMDVRKARMHRLLLGLKPEIEKSIQWLVKKPRHNERDFSRAIECVFLALLQDLGRSSGEKNMVLLCDVAAAHRELTEGRNFNSNRSKVEDDEGGDE